MRFFKSTSHIEDYERPSVESLFGLSLLGHRTNMAMQHGEICEQKQMEIFFLPGKHT